jgi:hypothetical protein
MNKKVITPKGEGILEKVFVSDLGYLMIKVYFPKEKIYSTWNIGQFNDLPNKDIKIIDSIKKES